MDTQTTSEHSGRENFRKQQHKRMFEKVPSLHMGLLREETRKALEMTGVKTAGYLEDLKPDDRQLIDEMMPFVLDHGSMYPLKPLLPLPEGYIKVKDSLEYDNSELPPVPVLSAAVAPYILSQPEKLLRSVDGTGIYGHNEVSGPEGDRAIRKLLRVLTTDMSVYKTDTVIRWKGDLFLVIHDNAMFNSKFHLDEEKFSDSVIRSTKKTEDPENYLRPDEENRLTSFRQTHRGIVLDTARMHYNGDEVKKEDVAKKIAQGPIKERTATLESLHPELESLIKLVKQKPEKEQSVLIGIIEDSLYDLLLQPLVNSMSKDGIELRTYKDAQDIQYHLQTSDSALTKLEIASTLKTINGEEGFGEIAGDAFLCAIYKKIVQELKQQIPDLKRLTTMRRWSDYYFVEDKDTSKKIARVLLQAFQKARYAKISRINQLNQLDSYNIEFINSPPTINSDELLIPIMPLIGIDEGIKLFPIESGTDDNTAAALRLNNEMIFSTRMKVLDEEIRNSRPRLIVERLENPRTEDIEFILFHILNPTDPKRGIPRLRNIFKANDEDMEVLINYVEMFSLGLQISHKSSMRDRVKAMGSPSDAAQTAVLNILLRLSGEAVKDEKYMHKHNEVSVFTEEMIGTIYPHTIEEETAKVMDRLKAYTSL